MSLIGKLPITSAAIGAAWLLVNGHGSPAVQDRLQDSLSPENFARLASALKWLFAASSALYANTTLSSLAMNNFELTSTSKWHWNEEIAVVTGGSSGFGALFSKDLARKGIRVAALDVNEPPKDIADNPRITFFKCDVTKVEQVREVAQKVRSQLGNPTILINNAGIANWPATILDRTPEALNKIVGVNLLAHYYLTHEFVPYMTEIKKGHIVTIASTASFIAMPSMVDYCVTKAGALAFHEGLVAELRSVYNAPQIKLTICHPDWADTGIVAAHKDRLAKAKEVIMDPQVVSDAVVGNILADRGGRLMLGGQVRPASFFRALPDWLTWLVRQDIERRHTGVLATKSAKDRN